MHDGFKMMFFLYLFPPLCRSELLMIRLIIFYPMFIIIRSSYCGPFDSSRIGESFKSPSVYSYSVIQWMAL